MLNIFRSQYSYLKGMVKCFNQEDGFSNPLINDKLKYSLIHLRIWSVCSMTMFLRIKRLILCGLLLNSDELFLTFVNYFSRAFK